MTRYLNKNSVLEQLFFVQQHTSYSTFMVTLLYCYVYNIYFYAVHLQFYCTKTFFSLQALSHASNESKKRYRSRKKETCIIKYTLLCKFLCYIKLCKCKLLVIFCFIYSWKKWFYFMICKVCCKQVNKLFFW